MTDCYHEELQHDSRVFPVGLIDPVPGDSGTKAERYGDSCMFPAGSNY